MITAIVLYNLPPSIGLEECRSHYTTISKHFVEEAPGLIRKQFICTSEGDVGGGVCTWESREAAERFYSGSWLAGIRERYDSEPTITYYEAVALADKATGYAGAV